MYGWLDRWLLLRCGALPRAGQALGRVGLAIMAAAYSNLPDTGHFFQNERGVRLHVRSYHASSLESTTGALFFYHGYAAHSNRKAYVSFCAASAARIPRILYKGPRLVKPGARHTSCLLRLFLFTTAWTTRRARSERALWRPLGCRCSSSTMNRMASGSSYSYIHQTPSAALNCQCPGRCCP